MLNHMKLNKKSNFTRIKKLHRTNSNKKNYKIDKKTIENQKGMSFKFKNFKYNFDKMLKI